MKPQEWITALTLFPLSTLSLSLSSETATGHPWDWNELSSLTETKIVACLDSECIVASFSPCSYPFLFLCPFPLSPPFPFFLVLTSSLLQSPSITSSPPSLWPSDRPSASELCCVLWCVVMRGGQRLALVQSIQSDMLFTLTWPDLLTCT